MGSSEPPRSPVPGLGLEGYLNEIAVAPGGSVRVMAAGPGLEASVRVARLIHGDPNPLGPGYRDEPVEFGQPDQVTLGPKHLDLGSYVEIPNADVLNPAESFSLGIWFQPTLLGAGWHALMAKWSPGEISYGLFCAGRRFLAAAVSHDGETVAWCTARDVVRVGSWNFAAMSYDAGTGRLDVYQPSRYSYPASDRPEPAGRFLHASREVGGGQLHVGVAPLLIGALPSIEAGGEGHWAHFNGKVAAPTLLGRAIGPEGAAELMDARGHEISTPVLGRWDLSRDVEGTRVVDVSANGNHGRAVNAPSRAVTGPQWEGFPARLYGSDPGVYDAIHLHDDDLDDAQWPPSFTLEVPASSKPGIYAASLHSERDELYMPFVVRTREPTSPLALLVPTMTWQAYSSNTLPYSYTEDGVLDRGVCLYVLHSDGSRVYYVSRRRPNRALNPKRGFQNWGAHTVAADLYLVDWLETKGIDYDVFADEDLHRRAVDLLRPYRCIVLGSHPEYWTDRMLTALGEYIAEGGRLLYLGGNGLLWVTTIDAERPHLLEVRKWDEGETEEVWPAPPGEWQHSTSPEVGGLWSRRGRPPSDTVGVEFSAQMDAEACDLAARLIASGEPSWGFHRTEESHAPEFAFVFDGVGPSEVIGDFGLNLGTAAGFEMDATPPWAQAGEVTRLARATHPCFAAHAGVPVPAAADLALATSSNGGAVFAAGSVTWSGSLSHSNYDNNVSRITENVMRRFIDRGPEESVLDGVDIES